MRIIILFSIAFLVISCSKKTKSKTSEFDTILGQENSETLNFLVSDFENNFLTKQYPNIEIAAAYEQFLIDIRDTDIEFWRKFSKKGKQRFKASNLQLEIYKFPDSVWIIESNLNDIDSGINDIDSVFTNLNILDKFPKIKKRYKDITPDGETEYFYDREYINLENITNTDSVIKREMEIPIPNTIGKYMQALYSLQNKNELYKNYYDRKENYGIMNPKLVASGMLYENIDLNNVLNRKLIVLEFVY